MQNLLDLNSYGDIAELMQSFNNVYNSNSAWTIEFPNSKITDSKYFNTYENISVNFKWLAKYQTLIHNVVSAFLYLTFSFGLIKNFPDIIRGQSVIFKSANGDNSSITETQTYNSNGELLTTKISRRYKE